MKDEIIFDALCAVHSDLINGRLKFHHLADRWFCWSTG